MKKINAKEFFLEWCNDWLTVAKIAEHYNITDRRAKALIKRGRLEFGLQAGPTNFQLKQAQPKN